MCIYLFIISCFEILCCSSTTFSLPEEEFHKQENSLRYFPSLENDATSPESLVHGQNILERTYSSLINRLNTKNMSPLQPTPIAEPGDRIPRAIQLNDLTTKGQTKFVLARQQGNVGRYF